MPRESASFLCGKKSAQEIYGSFSDHVRLVHRIDFLLLEPESDWNEGLIVGLLERDDIYEPRRRHPS